MPYEDLFTDPFAAFGLGLLTSRDNPVGVGAQVLQQASSQKADRRDKEIAQAIQAAKLNQPKLQFNPVTGEMFDMRTGLPYDARSASLPQPTEGGGSTYENPKIRQIRMEEEARVKAKSSIPGTAEYKNVQESEQKEQKQKTMRETAQRLLSDLLSNEGAVRNVVGTFDSKTPTIVPSSADAETKINQLRSILTAENLGLMTGVLSETDLKVIADIAGGGLVTNRSDDGFIDELKRLQQAFGGSPGSSTRPGVIDFSDLPE